MRMLLWGSCGAGRLRAPDATADRTADESRHAAALGTWEIKDGLKRATCSVNLLPFCMTMHHGAVLWLVQVGLLLSLGMAPRWDVVRESNIPAGSMSVPADAEEVEVVVDNQPASLRIVSAVSCALSLIVLTGVGMYERGVGQ